MLFLDFLSFNSQLLPKLHLWQPSICNDSNMLGDLIQLTVRRRQVNMVQCCLIRVKIARCQNVTAIEPVTAIEKLL